MFMLNTKEHYKVAHITNEIGNYIIGGIATVINELYSSRNGESCFIHLYDDSSRKVISTADYPGEEDIFIISINNLIEIANIDVDIAVLHYYGLADSVSEEIIGNKKLIYVIHSVNTPEPYDINNPFGNHVDIQNAFTYLCNRADRLICVSKAEKDKLLSIFDGIENKTEIIYNGMTFNNYQFIRDIKANRTKFGYLGRLDYRKGILEADDNSN